MASIKIKASFAPPVSSLVNVEDEGALIVSTQDLNFVGAGVTVTENPLGTAEIDIPGTTIDIEDEGVAIITNPGAINFTGAGVTVTENPLGTAEIDIPGNPLTVKDEGLNIVSNPANMNFIGAGVTVTENPAGTAEVSIPGNPLTVKDEGVSIVSNPANINFIGAGVTVTQNPAGTAEVSIPGNPLTVKDEGVSIVSNPANINFIGAGVTVTQNPAGTAEVSIPGGGAGIAIGDAVGGAASGDVLFVNSAIQLAKNTLFKFDTANTRMSIGVAIGGVAKLNVRGTGTTSATFSQINTDSSGNDTLQIRDDGAVKFGGGSFGHPTLTRFQINNGTSQVLRLDNNTLFVPDTIVSSNAAPLTISGQTFGIKLQPENGNTGFINIGNAKVNTINIAAGTRKHVEVNQGYTAINVAATNVTVNQIDINPAINMNLQTGTKIFRGIYHNPTLTGTIDHRAFESVTGGGYFNTSAVDASAVRQADSTTKGCLPPRMTTAQKNAIAAPAAGLVVYDTTLNKLCVYTTAWETITSV